MNVANDHDLAVKYRAVRRASLRICEPLSAEDHVVQTMPDVSPAKWHLAHVTWFFEAFVLPGFGIFGLGGRRRPVARFGHFGCLSLGLDTMDAISAIRIRMSTGPRLKPRISSANTPASSTTSPSTVTSAPGAG